MEDAQFRRFQSSIECGSTDVARLAASQHNYSSAFLTNNAPLERNDKVVEMAMKLKLGLPPIESLSHLHTCPLCNTRIGDDHYHALGCTKLVMDIITMKHDVVCQAVAEYARSVGCLAKCTTRHEYKKGVKLEDGVIFLANKTILFDITGCHTTNHHVP